MSFSSLVRAGIEKIYSEDFDSQEHYLTTLYKEVRRSDDVPSTLFKAKAFFVPNETYMLDYFGKECLDPMYDMYNYEEACIWQNQIVFAVKNVANTPVGFVGFDPLIKLESLTAEQKLPENYYRYSSASVFNRGKYLFCLDDMFNKAVKDGYIVLADGVFDMLNLAEVGFNSASMMGSVVSEELIFQLKFIDHIFVAEDNDKAGRSLYTELKKRLPSVKYVRQNLFKDVDDMLKSKYRDQYIRELHRAISNNTDLVLRFKP